MTSIKGYADLLLLGAAGGISDQQQHFLETIKQNADRLSVLVNDLLDISRIDQGRMELRFSLVDIKSVLEMVSEHVQGRSKDEKRPMNVVVEPPEDQGRMVWGDYDKVARIVTNLADNAFSYTPEGGTITFGASFDAESGHAIITVADTGIGIPPDVADRVYERFVRGNETQDLVMDTPGTGLGLSIVRELVEMHNGRSGSTARWTWGRPSCGAAGARGGTAVAKSRGHGLTRVTVNRGMAKYSLQKTSATSRPDRVHPRTPGMT